MKILKYIPLTGILILALVNITLASSANIGAQFLQFSPSPRASALGDAYLSQSESADSIYYNPASSAFIPDVRYSGSYIRWIGAMNYFSFFASRPISPIMTFGIGLTGLSIGGIPETTDPGNGNITLTGNNISAADFCGLLNYSYQFLPGLSGGANIKLISQSLTSVKSYAFGSDIGLFYDIGFTGIRLGAVVQNLGTTAKFVTDNASLPFSIKGGGSYDFNLARYNNFLKNILFTAQARSTTGEKISVSGGIEARFWDILMLRGGYEYQPDSDSSGFKTGVGINIDKLNYNYTAMGLQINYSLNLFKTLGMAHSFQINTSFRFFGDRVTDKELLKQADSDLTNADYDVAMTNYMRVLQQHPKHARSAYNTACIYAMEKDNQNALIWLKYAIKIDNSPAMKKRIETDPDLDNIRKLPEYSELMKEFQKK